MAGHPGNTPFLRFLRAFVPFGFMGSMSYSFANPDENNIYDIFPVVKSKYAFICSYAVKPDERVSFERKWKDVARFYQQQDGYLYNKLLRSETRDPDGNFVYIDVNQWATGDAYKTAASKTLRQTLFSRLYDSADKASIFTHNTPMMYKTVVDDTQFTPSEVLQARGNVGLTSFSKSS